MSNHRVVQRVSAWITGIAACLALLGVVTKASSSLGLGGAPVEKVSYKGWKNNIKLSNGEVEVVATLDVGPRIIRYAFVGGDNVFKEYEDQLGKTGEKDWQIRGGHRLWHAPEAMPRTYFPDNDAVAFKELPKGGVRLTPPAETTAGVQKEIDLQLDSKGTRVTVLHRLTNTGSWPIELAPWSLSVMAPGGVAIIPLPKKVAHGESLLPNGQLVFWSYTNLNDPRYRFGGKYITLRQDSTMKSTKIGMKHDQGWVGYLREGVLFVKRFERKAGAAYPDFGCNFETYTDENMLEVESLGALITLEPGKSIEHQEIWELHKGVPAFNPAKDDEAVIEKEIATRVMK